MRWSIRNQILLPLIGIQAIAVTAATVTTATVGRRAGANVKSSAGSTMCWARSSTGVSLTRASVLAKMRGLSGAHFIAWGAGWTGDGNQPADAGTTCPSRSARCQPRCTWLARGIAINPVWEARVISRCRSARRCRPRGGSLVVLYPETSWRQARREAAMPALLLGVGSLGAMVLVTSWIAHRMSSRIRRVQQQVAGIAAGDFRELDPGDRHDEVAELTRIDQPDVLSAQGNAADDPAIGASQAAGPARRRAGASTSQLAHRCAHERPVARPTTSGPRPATRRSRSPCASSSSPRSKSRDCSRPVASSESPPEVCDLHQLLGEVARLVDPACQHARVSIRHLRREDAGAVAMLFADRSSLRAAILNLALNAIEAAGQGGTVSLEAYSRGGELSVEVVDNGPGPPPDLVDVMYEPFVTSKPEGVGLGLALARQVALDHDGRLTWSRSGVATHFILTLPEVTGTLKGHA